MPPPPTKHRNLPNNMDGYQNEYYGADFGLIDFVAEANFDQFIDLIRGENDLTGDQPIFNFCNQVYDDRSNAAVADDGCHFLPPPIELFDYDVAAGNPNFGLLNNECQNQAELEDEILMDEGESSGSGTAGTSTPRGRKNGGKVDRSRTLVSERRRRGRMKEKLYALRSLVPNITKMDKASIVGDAVLYVQDLQTQAKKLRAEVAALEAGETKNQTKSTQNAKSNNPTCLYPTTKKIIEMDVSEVEDRGFYVRVVSNRSKGVAMLLYRALELLTSFEIRSSNLAASADQNYVLTFTLHTMEGGVDVSLQSVKVWIASVFLNQGFEFQT